MSTSHDRFEEFCLPGCRCDECLDTDDCADDDTSEAEEVTARVPSHHPCGCRVTMPELTGYEEHVCEYQERRAA